MSWKDYIPSCYGPEIKKCIEMHDVVILYIEPTAVQEFKDFLRGYNEKSVWIIEYDFRSHPMPRY
jgi:hypothetical protein